MLTWDLLLLFDVLKYHMKKLQKNLKDRIYRYIYIYIYIYVYIVHKEENSRTSLHLKLRSFDFTDLSEHDKYSEYNLSETANKK